MADATPRRALLLGHGGMLWPLPPVLRSAGFEVDVVTLPSPHFRHRIGLRTVKRLPDRRSLLVAAAELDRVRPYDWIIIGDDDTLLALRDSPDLSQAQKTLLAPVTAEEHLWRLGSKVGQAEALSRAGVTHPSSRAVKSEDQAVEAATQIGWPVFLKADAGSAGRAVAKCENADELRREWRRLVDSDRSNPTGAQTGGSAYPAIVQQAIPGTMLDLSGIFFDGRLIHFTNALGNEMPGRIGMSSVRRYRPSAAGDAQVVGALGAIGRTMGIHGFANISAIEDRNGVRWYFEVDLRPTIWAPYGAEFGDDPVYRLREWFDRGEALANTPFAAAENRQPTQGRAIACFTRQSRRDLVRNRASVLRDVPWYNPDGVLLLAKSLILGGDL